MNFKLQKHKLNLKRISVNGIAILFLIYAFADITVLQAYCVNEAVGIPPSHHLAKNNQEQQSQDNQNNLHHSDNQEEVPQDCGDDCCFCCSSHVLISSFSVKFNIVKIVSFEKSQSFHYKKEHTNSNLKNLFRPPRNA